MKVANKILKCATAEKNEEIKGRNLDSVASVKVLLFTLFHISSN